MKLSVVVLVVVAAIASGVLAGASSAAPYTVWSCRDAQGAPLPTTAWVPAGNAGTQTDTCATGGALYVGLRDTDTVAGAISGYRFDAPPGVTITRYTASLHAITVTDPASPAPYLAGLAQGTGLSAPTVLDGCDQTVNTCQFGVHGDPSAPSNEVANPVVLGGLALVARCTNPTGSCTAASADAAHAQLFRSAVELDDPSAPTVGAPGGTVAAVAPLSGVRTVVADAGDVGSGVRSVALLVDGAVVDRQDGSGTCAPPYTVADPCPRGLRTTFALDTDALAEGAHAIALRAIDAAGNATDGAVVDRQDGSGTCAPPYTVADPCPRGLRTTFALDTDALAEGAHAIALRATDAAGNTTDGAPLDVVVRRPPAAAPPANAPAPPVAAPSPPPAVGATIAVRLTVPARVALPAARAVRGTVVDAAGRPRAGVRVRFASRPLGGEGTWRAIGKTVVSDAAGHVRVPRPPASAEVRTLVASPGFSAASATTAFVGKLKVSIRASAARLRNGGRLTLRGRLANAGGAADGHLVLVQSRVRGSWKTVDSVRAAADGAITWRYRFTNTVRPARYRFRFVVPAQRGLPWGSLATRQVRVLVAGSSG